MTCCCGGQGFLKVQYQTGEPFDIAICLCSRGQRLRVWLIKHPDWIETVWHFGPEHRIAWLEDFEEDPAPSRSSDSGERAKSCDRTAPLPAYTKAAQLTPPKRRM